MKRPPAFLHFEMNGFCLVFPLFLLWPIAFVLLIPFFVLVAGWMVISGEPARVGRFACAILDVFCSLRGLEIDVSGGDSKKFVIRL